jgi:SpoIIAA-like
MIERLNNFPENVLAFICRGRVTKADYDSVLVPAVVKALESQMNVRLYYEIAADFVGFEVGAMWEDFKVGMAHPSRWERIAVVTDIDWIRHTVRLFGFLIPATVRLYPLSEADKARTWIVAAS